MDQIVVVRGRYADRTFIPEDKLPDVEGKAELTVTQAPVGPAGSIFDLFGKAPHLRSGEDIAAQIAEDRGEWGEP